MTAIPSFTCAFSDLSDADKGRIIYRYLSTWVNVKDYIGHVDWAAPSVQQQQFPHDALLGWLQTKNMVVKSNAILSTTSVLQKHATHTYWNRSFKGGVLSIPESRLAEFYNLYACWPTHDWISEYYNHTQAQSPCIRFFIDFELDNIHQSWSVEDSASFARCIHAVLLQKVAATHQSSCGRLCIVFARGKSPKHLHPAPRAGAATASGCATITTAMSSREKGSEGEKIFSVGLHIIFPDFYVHPHHLKHFHAHIVEYFARLQQSPDTVLCMPDVPIPSRVVCETLSESHVRLGEVLDPRVYEEHKINLRLPFCEKYSPCSCKKHVHDCQQCGGIGRIWTPDRVYIPQCVLLSPHALLPSAPLNLWQADELEHKDDAHATFIAWPSEAEVSEFICRPDTFMPARLALALGTLRVVPHGGHQRSPYHITAISPAPIPTFNQHKQRSSSGATTTITSLARKTSFHATPTQHRAFQSAIDIFVAQRYAHLYRHPLIITKIFCSSLSTASEPSVKDMLYDVYVTGQSTRLCPQQVVARPNGRFTSHRTAGVYFTIYLQRTHRNPPPPSLPFAVLTGVTSRSLENDTTNSTTVVAQQPTQLPSACVIVAKCSCKCLTSKFEGGHLCKKFRSPVFHLPNQICWTLYPSMDQTSSMSSTLLNTSTSAAMPSGAYWRMLDTELESLKETNEAQIRLRTEQGHRASALPIISAAAPATNYHSSPPPNVLQQSIFQSRKKRHSKQDQNDDDLMQVD